MKNRFTLLIMLALLTPISSASQSPQTAQTADTHLADTSSSDNQTQTASQAPIPANPHDPANGTYLKSIMPDDSELSKANTELLAKNANLMRELESLNTQVNVLVQERTNQLFVYGAITAIVSLVIGFVLGKLTSRQGRW